jgi:hypothetical protein
MKKAKKVTLTEQDATLILNAIDEEIETLSEAIHFADKRGKIYRASCAELAKYEILQEKLNNLYEE